MRKQVVLVVDDDADLRASLASTLEDVGYEVKQASGGAEGVTMVRASPPDLILLDLMMPDGNGWDVLKHLRAAAETVEVPVVIVSAYASAVPKGAIALLRKPVRRDDLIEAAAAHARAAGS